MKTLKILSLVVMSIALSMSCVKDEDLLEDEGDLLLKKGSKKGQVTTIVVEPTGIDDTGNLKNAFANAIADGDGSIVMLVEGEYFIDLIEVKEFRGTLKGAGKGKTIISTVPDVDVDAFINQNLKTNLICFVGGDVCVRDLTIHTPQGPLSTGSKKWLHGQLSFIPITAQYVAENEHVKANIDNVEFITTSHVRYGLLAESGFFKGEPESVPLGDVDISVTNCSFNGPYWHGALFMEMRKATMVVGTKNKGNSFNNCDLGIWHNVNLKATVEGNTFTREGGWFPFQIVNHPYPKTLQQIEQDFQSVVNIEKNTFDISSCTGAILINDNRRFFFPDEIPRLVQVKNNKIHVEGGMKTAMACLNMNGMVIRNNKFTGEAEFGLRIFPQPADHYSPQYAEIYSDNGLILGNNFSNAEYSETTVLLGEGTRNWTIVGGNLGESIINEGENNFISGFNNNTSNVPFGQTIVDNLKEMKSPMHDLK